MEKELDTNWINNFIETESEYDNFYKTEVTKINIYGIFVRKNEVKKVKKLQIDLTNDEEISPNSILLCSKKLKQDEQKNYSLTSLLKYNIDIEPADIRTLIYEENPQQIENYLHEITYIKPIKINRTIKLFHHLNGVYFIFTERENIKHNTTKKIYLTKNPHTKNPHTNKVSIKKSSHKTRRVLHS